MCKRDSIDECAELIGINPKTWKEFRMKQYKERELPSIRELPNERELPLERELPPKRFTQMEFEELTNPIDEREAYIRHRQALAQRWFGYYKKCETQKKMRLIDQFNKIALMGKER